MTDQVILRTGRDRLRYTITFELLLMTMLIPAGVAFFDKPVSDIGVLGAILSGKAMVLNLIYNWTFDRFDARAGRISSQRSHKGRLLHAMGFELSLTVTSLPIYILWLGIGIWEALIADVVVTSFVVAYTYLFTLAYDKAFPMVCPQTIPKH